MTTNTQPSLVFDLDDTLIPSSKLYAQARKLAGVNEAEYQLARKTVKLRLAPGNPSNHNRLLYFKLMLEQQRDFSAQKLLDLNQKYEDFFAKELHQFCQNEKRRQVLIDLSKKFQLAILTNENTRTQILKLKELDPEGEIFKIVVTSEEVGEEKPSAKMFQEVQSRLGETSSITMIGDDLDKDLRPAAAYGWRAIWLNEFVSAADRAVATPQTEVVESLLELPYKL